MKEAGALGHENNRMDAVFRNFFTEDFSSPSFPRFPFRRQAKRPVNSNTRKPAFGARPGIGTQGAGPNFYHGFRNKDATRGLLSQSKFMPQPRGFSLSQSPGLHPSFGPGFYRNANTDFNPRPNFNPNFSAKKNGQRRMDSRFSRDFSRHGNQGPRPSFIRRFYVRGPQSPRPRSGPGYVRPYDAKLYPKYGGGLMTRLEKLPPKYAIAPLSPDSNLHTPNLATIAEHQFDKKQKPQFRSGIHLQGQTYSGDRSEFDKKPMVPNFVQALIYRPTPKYDDKRIEGQHYIGANGPGAEYGQDHKLSPRQRLGPAYPRRLNLALRTSPSEDGSKFHDKAHPEQRFYQRDLWPQIEARPIGMGGPSFERAHKDIPPENHREATAGFRQ